MLQFSFFCGRAGRHGPCEVRAAQRSVYGADWGVSGRVTFYVSEMDVGRLVRRKRPSSECGGV